LDYLDKVKDKRAGKADDSHKKELVDSFTSLSKQITLLLASLKKTSATKVDSDFVAAVKQLSGISNQLKQVRVTSDQDIKRTLADLSNALTVLDVKPVVNVPAPQVTVNEKEVDFKPLIKALKGILAGNATSIDVSPVTDAVQALESSIKSLQFPASNFILPFKNTEGAAVQVQLDSSGNLPISASLSGADGAILDGVDSNIKATVKESTADSGNFGLVVVNPDGTTISGGGGGSGTQYDDGEAVATPVGTVALGFDGTNVQALATDSSGNLQTEVTNTVTVDGTVSITANSAVNVAQMNGVNTTMGNGASGTGVQRVTIASDSTGVIIARGAAATDAAVSGNPVYIGSRASTAEPTAMSADNDAVPFWLDRRGRQVVTMQAGTATLANVSGATSSTTLIAANTLRKGATIHNDSTAILYLKFGSAASSTSFTIKMFEDDYYEVPYGYSGIITGIWASATGAARCTEIS